MTTGLETHTFTITNGLGETHELGLIDVDDVPCIHDAIQGIARRNERLASPQTVGALASVLDEVFVATERMFGNAFCAVPFGNSLVACTRLT